MPSISSVQDEKSENEESKSQIKTTAEDDSQSEKSRENSGTMLELNPFAKVLKILREGSFLKVLISCMQNSEMDKMSNLLKVI